MAMPAVTFSDAINERMNAHANEWFVECNRLLVAKNYVALEAHIKSGIITFGSETVFLYTSVTIHPLHGAVRNLFSFGRFDDIQWIANICFQNKLTDKTVFVYSVMSKHQIKKSIQINRDRSGIHLQ